MKWKHPPIIKIYEALGAIADGRVEISGNTAKVFSSSGNKFYEISFNATQKALMANDNGSYWKGYLGYPSIAFLFKTGLLEYQQDLVYLLKDIKWKDLNQKYKNDFRKTLEYILSNLTKEQKVQLEESVQKIDKKIRELDLNLLGKKTIPPEGY